MSEKLLKTLVVNYSGLKLGGIETSFASLMKYSLECGYRVIWITTPESVINSDFKEISENSMVEKVYKKRKFNSFDKLEISFSPDEEVTIISCEPIDFVKGERIRRRAKNVASINHFLILPHYTGSAYYPERFFSSKLMRKLIKAVMRKKIVLWNDNDCIRAFSQKHLDKYEENYNIFIPDKTDKVMRWPNKIEKILDEELREKAYERITKFNIITCSRFDFPHKGYILGLIDEFAVLKLKYPQIQLIIVGYGAGERVVNDKIKTLPEDIQKSIVLTGALHPNELKEKFKDCHLNVGLAGALGKGAECALPSLLVRHYTEKCESYGFINDIQGNFLRSDPGSDIKAFIEFIINCNEEEYIQQSKNALDKIMQLKKNDPEYLFRQKNSNCDPTIGRFEEIAWRVLNFVIYFKICFLKVKGYDEE